jgi:Mrp family chromosome partitioning ATPase
VEGVFQALQRVRDSVGAKHASDRQASVVAPLGHNSGIGRNVIAGLPLRLDRTILLSNKIVAFDSSRDQTRPYDVLRNLVLDDLAEIGSRTIAVTAPTLGCGTTVTAANLALSIARLRTTKVLLLDCNEAGPGIAEALGTPKLLADAEDIDEAACLRTAEVEGVELYVGSLAGLKRQGDGLRQNGEASFAFIEQQLRPVTIVLDLPPMLIGDQTLPLILEADIVLLVLAVGRSTVADLEACKTYLSESSRVHMVLNKSRKHGL